ncbi:NitT/TauT family transport system permease protein [Inquilinus ginsengisoli]|jgi:NitT/TauT family transport system permease protein|uniref:NitT/TauT family transport system permease protein n=1 Tax=Inquilinus ginsengisoli TaxID=363840 RepID=A0ABU1JTF7_9PROT|nr:ABC transporter permease [Inquilinus ginsengisoli]MDR6291905.1 NitT/TauT family transport system permease protein [Inquilinus ginsengisoli]
MTQVELQAGDAAEDAAAIEAARRAEPGRVGKLAARIAVPGIAFAAFIALWQWYVVAYQVPHYILPAPTQVLAALVTDWPILSSALEVTLGITFAALAAALVGGVALAILFVQWRWLELAFYPYAVVLQVTPIVAIAPLIIIYAPSTESVLLICAFIVAFFPILSNMTQGLKSTDHNLLNLFELYGASRWQALLHLRIPAALPYFTTGLRIGGGLALIGSVVAEFAAGSAGAQSGLAFRILEAGRRLNVPRLFAALLLITLTGIAIFALTSLVSHLLLRRWHESAIRREN